MRRRWTTWTACLALIAASMALRAAILHTTGVDVLLRPLLVAVALAAIVFSPRTGMTVALLGAALNYLAAMHPRTGGFAVGSAERMELLLFVGSAGLITLVVGLPSARRRWWPQGLRREDGERVEARLRKANSVLERRVRERTREVEARSEQLRALALDLAQTESRERKRLAQVLHDHFQQLLSAARLKVGMLRRTIPACRDSEMVRQLEDLLAEAIAASRSLATELSPPVLHDAGLLPALQWLVRRMEKDYALHIDLQVEEYVEPDNEQLSAMVFECVRELLFNVHKHAGVDSAQMLLQRMPDGLLRVRIVDAGKGFDPTRELHNRQEREGQEVEGGFGLFSIRERLSLIGGVLTIQSNPGNGTTVDLRVPSTAARTASPMVMVLQAAMPPAMRHGARLRVMVADDHTLFREELVAMLSQEPCLEVVAQAGDGKQALEQARQLRPDVIIVDISMPHMNGMQLTSAVTRELPGTQVIGLSMHEHHDMAQAMREAGAAAYFTKSSAGDETLLNLLRDIASASAVRL